MGEIKRILVPVDGSESSDRAIDKAIALAQACGSKIDFLYVANINQLAINACLSDAILDAILEKDPAARVACETAVTTGMILCMGEISTKSYADIPHIARSVVNDIGYDRAKFGFDGNTCSVITSIDEQIAIACHKGSIVMQDSFEIYRFEVDRYH